MQMRRGCAIAVSMVVAVSMIAVSAVAAEWQYRARLDVVGPVEKDLSLRVLTEVRILNDLHTKNESHFDIGLDYRFRKWLAFGPYYRHVTYEKGEAWAVEHRPHVDMTFKWGLAGLAFSNRNRLEYRMIDGNDAFRYRTRLMLKMRISAVPWIQTYLSEEPYYAFSAGGINKNRIIAGFDIGLPGTLSLGVNYVLDSAKREDTWTNLNAIAAVLKYRP